MRKVLLYLNLYISKFTTNRENYDIGRCRLTKVLFKIQLEVSRNAYKVENKSDQPMNDYHNFFISNDKIDIISIKKSF